MSVSVVILSRWVDSTLVLLDLRVFGFAECIGLNHPRIRPQMELLYITHWLFFLLSQA